MKPNLSRLKGDLIAACRILSAEGLVHGFGHVSARIPDSNRFILTPRTSLALVTEKDLLVMNLKGEVVQGKAPPPIEAPLHVAIFNRRSDIGAITRIHARKANYFSVTDRKIEPVHTHGSFFFGGVPVYPRTDLILTPELGGEVAAHLGENPAVLLRGNGQVTVGRSVPEAVIMALYLEEAADMLYGATQIGQPILLGSDEAARGRAQTLTRADLERAWNFYRNRIGKR